MKVINFGTYCGLEWTKLSGEYLLGLADMGNIEALNELTRRKNLPIEEKTIGFGAHSGKKLVELDVNYLMWVMEVVEDKESERYLSARDAVEYIKAHKRVNSSISFDDYGDSYIDVV